MKYLIKGQSFLLIFIILNLTYTLSSATISGFIRDSYDAEAIYDCNIILIDTKYGSVSNIDGYYALTSIPRGNYKLKASFTGYKSFEKDIKIYDKYQNLRLEIKLDEETYEIDETSVEVDAEESSEMVKNIRVSTLKINPRKLKTNVSFIQPDLFRVLKTLPGVISTSDYSTGLFVRGGQDDHNLILYDEITVYNPSHMFGIFSTFMTDALRETKLIKSAYPAEYGGRLGAVLDVKSRDGNKEVFEGDLSLSIFATEVIISGPFFSDGGFLLAGRRTHLEPILSFVGDTFDRDMPDYYFWEGQAQIYQDFGKDDRVIASSYMGTDDLSFEDMDMNVSWGNRTYSVRWQHIFSPKLFSKFKLASSNFFIDMSMGEDLSSINELQDYSFKNNYEYFANNDLTIKTGVEVKQFETIYKTEFQETTTIDITPGPQYNSSIFFEAKQTLFSIFTVVPGLRVTYNDQIMDDYKFMLAPRLSLKYMLDEKSSLTMSGGRFYQTLFTVKGENEPIQVVSQWFNIDDSVEPGISNNFVLGYEINQEVFNNKYRLTIEGYFKTMENLQSWSESRASNDDALGAMVIANNFDEGDAYAYGIETYIEKSMGKLNGNISYTYGKVKKTLDKDKDFEFNTYWDSPHNFKVSLNYNFTKNFNIGTVVNYSTGKPYTETIGIFVQQNPDGTESIVEIKGELNAMRYPDYFRADISANYTWFYSNKSRLLLNLSILNLSNNENIQTYFYKRIEDDEGNFTLEKKIFPMFPILPSIRVSYSF